MRKPLAGKPGMAARRTASDDDVRDVIALMRFPRVRDRFDFDLLPAPFQGHPDRAQVILLALNTGGTPRSR